MADPRMEKLALVLVDYSVHVKKGDVVVIKGIGTEALPIIKELHRLSLMRGAAYVECQFEDPSITRDFFNHANKAQISYMPQHQLDLMKKCDCYIGVRGQDNAMNLANADMNNMSAYSRTMEPILDERVNNTRWVVTIFPTHGIAQDAKMSKEEYEDFYFRSTIYDYAGLKRKQARLVRLMNKTKAVELRASDTELRFSIKGLPAISCHGDRNIPDGEVFTAPVRDSVNGHITYNTPSIYQGKEFNNIRLEFKNGRIVKAACTGSDKDLNKIFDTDEGARYVGEFSLGTNPNIRKPMRNTLFDEKIFGSIHLTPGRAYDECDNGNRSAVHWDLVKILVGDGDILFDGKVIQHEGVFVHKDLLDLNPPKERKMAEAFIKKAKV